MPPDGYIPHDPTPKPESKLGEPTPSLEFGGATEKSPHHTENEDVMIALRDSGVVVVIDGAGGHKDGAVASRIAGEEIDTHYSQVEVDNTPPTIVDNICKSLELAHEKIAEFNHQRGSDSMACIAIAKYHEGPDGSKKVYTASIGDARVYVVKANGSCRQCTVDNIVSDTPDEEINREFQSQIRWGDKDTFDSDEDKAYLASRNVVNYGLGEGEYKRPKVYAVDVEEGDTVVVTSDGVHDNLTNSRIAQAVQFSPSATEAATTLRDLASQESSSPGNQRRKFDDITVGTMRLKSSTPTQAEAPYVTEEIITGEPTAKEIKLNQSDSVEIDISRLEGGIEIELTDGSKYKAYHTRGTEGAHGDITLLELGHEPIDYSTGKYALCANEGEDIVLGRKPEVGGVWKRDVLTHIADKSVSRRHISLSVVAGKIVLRDLESANGDTTVRYSERG